jgi:hypothetical protein
MRQLVRTALAAVLAAGACSPATTLAQQGAPGVVAPTASATLAAPSLPGLPGLPALATMGFFETALAHPSDSAGQIAHVFSTYEARHAPGDATPRMRGISNIQLGHDGKRWYVVSLAWGAEDAAFSLPERYLQGR